MLEARFVLVDAADGGAGRISEGTQLRRYGPEHRHGVPKTQHLMVHGALDVLYKGEKSERRYNNVTSKGFSDLQEKAINFFMFW